MKYPNDPYIRGSFCLQQKMYKRTLRLSVQNYKKKLVQKIAEMDDKNPREFWQLVNKLRSDKVKPNKSDLIEPGVWFDYFKNLSTSLQVESDSNKIFDKKIVQNIKDYEKRNLWIECLDKNITKQEILDVCKHLKTNKSGATDMITNSMIKCCIESLVVNVMKLFNLIMKSTCFPQTWALGDIVAIFKSGDATEPCNYRGLTLSSLLSKVFTSILNKRLLSHFCSEELIIPNQIGFLPKKRTSDHVFVLNFIIKLFKTNKKPLYSCFIDLKKCFDSIWHEGLFYKLYNSGLSNKFVSIIRNIYSQTKSRVKLGRYHTDYFNTSVGTRQGCCLSPSLFNLYVNDLSTVITGPET